jgi:C_GCAxxG_C_C family probable redox protein
MTRGEIAISYHDKGCNCAQSVALSFLPEMGADEETVFRATEAFGAGMGHGKGTCGALSGALFVLSMLSSSGSAEKLSKVQTYKKAAEMYDRFEKECGHTVCHELKKNKVPCPECIIKAANLLDDYLKTSTM